MKRVLLVNDSKFECIIMKDILSSLGYDTTIGDEFNAIKLVHTISPEMVIANYIMKEIRGDQLISMIKLQYPKIKCILSSNNPISLENFHHRRIDAVLRTPVDKPSITKIIQGLEGEVGAISEAAVTYETGSHKEQESKAINNDAAPLKATKAANCDIAEGGSTTTQRFCHQCGSRLDSNPEIRFVFCPYCGTKLV